MLSLITMTARPTQREAQTLGDTPVATIST